MKIKTLNFGYFSKTIKLLVLMLCSVVGVGFVSGAEIYEVFVRFGDFWFVGVFIFFVLIFVLTNKIICEKLIINKNVNMQNLIINSPKNTIYVKSKIKSFLLFFNVLLMSAAMFSGLKALILQLFNHNYLLIYFLCVFGVFIVLFFGVSSLQKLDYFVLFFMFLLIAIFSFSSTRTAFVFHEKVFQHFEPALFGVFFSTLYVFMNIVQIEPIISSSNLTFSKKNARFFSFIFSMLLTFVLLVFILFFKSHENIAGSSMPFLKYFHDQGKGWLYFFSLGLIFALVSSLLASLIGVKRFLSLKLSNFSSTFFSILIAILLSFFDFSFYVSIVYPMIGFINFVIFVFL